MNYRHQYHAGNFADVLKHVLLLPLLRGMQRKEKGFLYLDTHAGRGRYDWRLLRAATRWSALPSGRLAWAVCGAATTPCRRRSRII